MYNKVMYKMFGAGVLKVKGKREQRNLLKLLLCVLNHFTIKIPVTFLIV